MPESTDRTPEQLAEAIDDIRAFMQRFGEAEWAKQLARDVELIRGRDFYGVERFLRSFGGMGSLNDSGISRWGNSIVLPEDRQKINEMLHGLISRAYEIAVELARSERRHGA